MNEGERNKHHGVGQTPLVGGAHGSLVGSVRSVRKATHSQIPRWVRLKTCGGGHTITP